MSETDSFIQEVSEEVRQDRMFAMWKKWAPAIIGGVALIVGGAAYWSWNQAQTQAAAEARGAAFMAADPGDVAQLTALPEQVDGPAALIAELTAAAALAESGETQAAIQAYQFIAERQSLTPEYADLAVLQAARLQGGDAARSSLALLVEPGRPYRLLALELRAALAVTAGDIEAAHADLQVIIADPMATSAARQRALAFLEVTGGAPDAAAG